MKSDPPAIHTPTDHLILLPENQLQEVELTPGHKSLAPVEMPNYAIFQMRRLPNGDIRPTLVEWTEWIPITDKDLADAGIPVSRQTIRRLGRAGFLEIDRIVPGRYALSLSSWVAHMKAVRENPDFWSKSTIEGRARCAELQQANRWDSSDRDDEEAFAAGGGGGGGDAEGGSGGEVDGTPEFEFE